MGEGAVAMSLDLTHPLNRVAGRQIPLFADNVTVRMTERGCAYPGGVGHETINAIVRHPESREHAFLDVPIAIVAPSGAGRSVDLLAIHLRASWDVYMYRLDGATPMWFMDNIRAWTEVDELPDNVSPTVHVIFDSPEFISNNAASVRARFHLIVKNADESALLVDEWYHYRLYSVPATAFEDAR